MVSRITPFNKTDGNSTRKVDTKIGIDIEMTKLNIVFNFRLVSLIKSTQGIFKVTLNPNQSNPDSIAFVYDPIQNTLKVFFYEGTDIKASITIPEFYKAEELLFWSNIHLTANPKEATLRVRHNSTRSLAQTTAVNINVQIEKNYLIDSGFTDSRIDVAHNFNYEISNVAVSSNLFEFFDSPMIFGRVLSDPCYKAVTANNICDSASRVVSTIRAQESFIDSLIGSLMINPFVVMFCLSLSMSKLF